MSVDEEARRRAAKVLAERLATPEGLREARRLQAEGRLAELLPPPRTTNALGGGGESKDDAEPATAPPPKRRREPIGIWQPREVEGDLAFVRPDPLPLGDHYSSRRILRPKRSELPLRVVLFGESAAAGYLYAPHLTPAMVLEAQLQAAGGAESFEVLDLARTNERLPIQPDVLVLYAGNNWNLLETPEVSAYAPSIAARLDFAEALRSGGLAGAARRAEERVREIAEGCFDSVALIAHAVGIPVVLVVPEVNLADWETRQPTTWLPADGIARWYGELERCLEHLERARWEDAQGRAREMIDLDGGACATSWRLLARAVQGLGDLEAAAAACRREIDAAPYATLAFLSAPQAGSSTRRFLLEKAAEHGWLAVDLKEAFARASGSPLPGHRLFLDYCHLSSEGMAIAMASVAAEVIEVSGLLEGSGQSYDPDAILRAAPLAVPPQVEASARLGAALHTAHRHLPVGPKRPLLRYWLESAVEADPGVLEALQDLLRMRTAPLPAILTAAQRKNFDSPYRLLLQHGLRWEHLDADLLLALAEVLGRHGIPAREELDLRLVTGFRPTSAGIDLTEPPYLWEPLERFFPDVMSFDDLPPRGYLRSPWPESSFCLIGDGESDLEIEATVRLPPLPGGAARRTGEVVLALDGKPYASFEATERWTRSPVHIEAAALHRGLHRLTLRWPMPPPVEDGNGPLRAAIERLEIGVSADLHPVFGEVYSLVAAARSGPAKP
jgi:hypothetical protein